MKCQELNQQVIFFLFFSVNCLFFFSCKYFIKKISRKIIFCIFYMLISKQNKIKYFNNNCFRDKWKNKCLIKKILTKIFFTLKKIINKIIPDFNSELNWYSIKNITCKLSFYMFYKLTFKRSRIKYFNSNFFTSK